MSDLQTSEGLRALVREALSDLLPGLAHGAPAGPHGAGPPRRPRAGAQSHPTGRRARPEPVRRRAPQARSRR